MSGGPGCSWLLEGKTSSGTFLGSLLALCLGHIEEAMLFSECWFVTDSFLGNEDPGDFRGRTPIVLTCLYLKFGGDSVYTASECLELISKDQKEPSEGTCSILLGLRALSQPGSRFQLLWARDF